MKSADGDGLTIVVNSSAGSALGGSPVAALREGLPGARVVELADGDDLTDALRRAVSDGAQALGIAGGDGSVNAAAQVALESALPLLVVPAGTLNHLAGALGIPDVDTAIQAARAARARPIDAGRIDGRIFLNTASVGGYVELVDFRERLESRLGKWPAFVMALIAVMARAGPVDLEIDGGRRRIWLAFVGNCRYDPPGITPRNRADLADGLIDLRVLEARPGWGKARLLWAALVGRIPRLTAYEERTATAAKVRFLGDDPRVSVDGETHDASRAFEIEKLSKALRVFVPPDRA